MSPWPAPARRGRPARQPAEPASPSPSPSPPPLPTATATPAALACPLNGLPLDDPTRLDKVAIAVQIENNPLARPQRNLSNADMVVEAPVEGDTTRFSAIF